MFLLLPLVASRLIGHWRLGESSCSKDRVTFTMLSYVFRFWMLYVLYELRSNHSSKDWLVKNMIRLPILCQNLLWYETFYFHSTFVYYIVLYVCQVVCVSWGLIRHVTSRVYFGSWHIYLLLHPLYCYVDN